MTKLPPSFKYSQFFQLCTLAVLVMGQAPQVFAQSAPTDLGTIGATTAAGAYRPDEEAKGTASSIAPTQSSLQATQPQSIITREFIDLSVAPTAEYTRIINIAPSMSGESSNGPGLSETKTIMRGFSDDQYNITFDGIPWGDTNNPAHHSTSFFPVSVIGGAVVERGPGNASNIGYATFGGTVNLFSKKPLAEETTSVFMDFGTWNTRLLGASYESGRMANSDATLQLNYQKLTSDGYLTNSPIASQNFTMKYERPVGDASLLTMFTSNNYVRYYQPDSNKGATLSQAALYGKNFQLNDTPGTMNYWGNNYTDKNTDFSYLRLRSELGNGWNADNSFYSYAYNNQTISTTDPTGATAVQTRDLNRNLLVGNIPGIDKQNKYRVWGDYFKATKKLDTGLARTGIWYEASFTDRHQYDLDLTTGQYSRVETTVNATGLNGSNRPIDSVKFEQQSAIHNLQPFGEFEWAVSPDTTVTPGVKLVQITRNVNAPVEQTTRQLNHSASLDYSATLPFLTVNHKLDSQRSVYAQYAQGIQIPDLNTFYVNNPTKNSTDAQRSTNYQVGFVSKSDRMTWDADVYYIDFNNKLVSNGLPATDPNSGFNNIGGAVYQGVEAQMAYVVGGGFSAYVNGSINSALSTQYSKQISGAPELTAALGGLYRAGAWSGSLIYKYTGATRQKDYDPTKAPINGQAYYDYYQTPGFGTLDLGVAYLITKPTSFGKSLKLQFNVFNVLDSSAVTSISTTNSNVAFDTYQWQTPRSYQVSLKADF